MERNDCQVINEFIRGINRGPFKCPSDFEGDDACACIEIGDNVGKEENRKDVYECAVYQAWLDLNRTVAGAGANELSDRLKSTRGELTKALCGYFKDKPKPTCAAFDEWLYDVINRCDPQKDLTLGQKQKLVNMAFKYLYCCKELREKEDGRYFVFCHMPLDTYTLKWYKANCSEKGEKVCKWSQMDDLGAYKQIVERIRGKITDRPVIAAEFLIWQQEKQRVEKAALISAAEKIMRDECCSNDLKALLEEYIKAKKAQAHRRESGGKNTKNKIWREGKRNKP